jgi:hypothetical protein
LAKLKSRLSVTVGAVGPAAVTLLVFRCSVMPPLESTPSLPGALGVPKRLVESS